MLKRYYYQSSIELFLKSSNDEIIGIITNNSEFNVDLDQRFAWNEQINILKQTLSNYKGNIFFEFSIPRMGRRVDTIVIIHNVIFVLEFKVGEINFLSSAVDQVWDYALDLKNFHQTSHNAFIAPILIATQAKPININFPYLSVRDGLLNPIKSNSQQLREIINKVLELSNGEIIQIETWNKGSYSPTPTIIEAALSLYNNHSVLDITRSEAAAINISQTSKAIDDIIIQSKDAKQKAICFVTGVPGAGKTLVGLDIATKHLEKNSGNSSVFLSGNGPLVAILREALTRDKVMREKEKGNKIKKGEVYSEVKLFIQNVHHFRDDNLRDEKPPFEHIAIFDEAQRAWNHTQTASFMKRKKNFQNFPLSEPEFLISCMDRHEDWALIVCLVGGGQEINTGEAGIDEWIESINRSFPHWKVYISNRLTDSEYALGNALNKFLKKENLIYKNELHLSVSMRSFRAERLSALIKQLLDLNEDLAKIELDAIKLKYQIVITRNINDAKKWLRSMARGSERFGIIVSSQAERLKPFAIDVKSPIDPVHWFLDSKDDVRSSYYLEDVATEFHVQGLELDWACVTWDADFRYAESHWETFSFVGEKWNRINKGERKQYLKNAYRVLLTRARQGMVIVVPDGEDEDATRKREFYDPTYNYLKSIGFEVLSS